MNTTELIDILKKYEKGGFSGKPREIKFDIPTLGLLSNPDIEVVCTGDGIAGPELTLEINGGRLYAVENYPDDVPTEAKWVIA